MILRANSAMGRSRPRHLNRKAMTPLGIVVALIILATSVNLSFVAAGLGLRLPAVKDASSLTLASTALENSTTEASSPQTTPAETTPANTVSNGAAAGTPAPAPSPQVARSCTGSSYGPPGALSLSGATNGLTAVIDAPAYYQVYGSSVPQLRESIANCPLRRAAGAYHAYTAYQINWTYSTNTVNGVCSIATAKVGLHVGMYLPHFAAEPATPASTAASWSNYAANLRRHEDGHVTINRDYAARLAAALQAIPPTDCATFDRQARTLAESYLTMLDTANELYDSQTSHGATQGAVL